MEKYKINGTLISMPTGWHDVTFKDAIHIIESNLSTIQLFSFFSKIPEDKVKQLNHDDDIYYFLKAFTFLERMPIEDKPAIPRSIKYKGQWYLFPHVLFDDPFDFGDTTVGQIEDMKALIGKKVKEIVGDEDREVTNNELMSIYPFVVAIYIQPIIEKEYNYKRAMKMAEDLKGELSFKEVVYMGSFFLMKLGNLTNGLKVELRQRNWITKKLRRGYKTLIAYLDSMLH